MTIWYLIGNKEKRMNFVTVRDFRTSPSAIWKKLPSERELIITNNGIPAKIISLIINGKLKILYDRG